MQQFFHAFETQVCAAYHQQRRNRGGQEERQQQRQRHEDDFVDERAFGDGPDNRQLPIGGNAGYLVGVQRQVVADYAGGFFGGHFGHQGDVVQNGRDVVEQGEKRGKGHVCGS